MSCSPGTIGCPVTSSSPSMVGSSCPFSLQEHRSLKSSCYPPLSKLLLDLPVQTVPFPWNPAAHLHEAVPSGLRRQLQQERASGVCREMHSTPPRDSQYPFISSIPALILMRHSEVPPKAEGESPSLAWPCHKQLKLKSFIRQTTECVHVGIGPRIRRVAAHL